MPAISPAEVEQFSQGGFRDELLDSINGLLKGSPGVTVAICEDELRSSVSDSVESDAIRDEMESVCALYRAVGWRVISGVSAPDGRAVHCWKFNARWF